MALGVLGPTIQEDGPRMNSTFDRMIDPTLLVQSTVPSLLRVDGSTAMTMIPANATPSLRVYRTNCFKTVTRLGSYDDGID